MIETAPTWRQDGRAWAAVILASGPSLTLAQCQAVQAWRAGDRSRRKVVALNNCWRLAPWADLLYACDPDWWRKVEGGQAVAPKAEEFPGLKLTQDPQIPRERADVARIPAEFKDGLSGSALYIRGGGDGGGNSGLQAYDLMVSVFGCKRIGFVGLDMQPAQDGVTMHWHGNHAGTNPQLSTFVNWRRSFAVAAAAATRIGVETVNASAATALECFPRMPISEALEWLSL